MVAERPTTAQAIEDYDSIFDEDLVEVEGGRARPSGKFWTAGRLLWGDSITRFLARERV